jgi:hypothetical protein
VKLEWIKYNVLAVSWPACENAGWVRGVYRKGSWKTGSLFLVDPQTFSMEAFMHDIQVGLVTRDIGVSEGYETRWEYERRPELQWR